MSAYLATILGLGILLTAFNSFGQEVFQLGSPAPKPPPAQVKHWAPPPLEPTITPASYLDNKTGVLWRRCELGKSLGDDGVSCSGTSLRMSWAEAIEVVNELNSKRFEGRSDWRLPSGNDLRSLLMDNATIRRGDYPVTRGPASAFGGYQLDFAQGKCAAANETIRQLFAVPNGVRGDFFESHRWMADNSDQEKWQNPLTINLVSSLGSGFGFCNLLIYAFLDDQFDSKRKGEIRPHAHFPVLVVSGGGDDAHWKKALGAVGNSAQVSAESIRRGQAEIAAIGANFERVKNFAREVMASGSAQSPSQYGGGVSSSNSDSVPRGEGSSSYICTYQCTNAKFTGADKTTLNLSVKASSESAARDETSRHGRATCYQQTQRVYVTGSASCRKQ